MIERYQGIAPDGLLREIEILAESLRGRSLQHVNSTRQGGGVAEILGRLVPLFQSLGIKTTWEVIEGSPEFFDVTKSMHNGLQGADIDIPYRELELYLNGLRDNSRRMQLDSDVVVVHDPQPAYLIELAEGNHHAWIWRCHIDLSNPNNQLWKFLRQAISKYALAVYHVPQFAQRVTIPQVLVAPSIDPLSEKNRELTEEEITKMTDTFGIDRQRPLLVQISRFDHFKDPLGVIAAFRQVRKNFDCQLVLAGGTATDDPESQQVLAQVQEAVGTDPDIFVLALPPDASLAVNALQRAATIILQKSTKEGFGLTVTEGMWKGKPVVAGAVGGIPSQLIHQATGFLVHSIEGAAFRLRYLLSHPKAAQRMGEQGREHVRRNFLITRHLRDYLLLMHMVLHGCPATPITLSK